MNRVARVASAAKVVLRGLMLALLGWFSYLFSRTLLTFIRLDAPFLDWQWYLAILILLLGLSARIVWHNLCPKWSRVAAVGLLVWIVVGYNGFGRVRWIQQLNADPIIISYWTSTWIFQASATNLEILEANEGRLYLSIGEQEFGDGEDELVSGLRRLAEYDIKVYLAVRASDYLSVPVCDEWIANVQEVASLVQREGLLNVQGIIGDAENPKTMPLDLGGEDRSDLLEAASRQAGLIRWMEEEYPRLRVGVTASWPLYVDRMDGDEDLSVMLRSTVDPPGGWSIVNSMTYSSYLPASWRAYYVYLVERMMTRLYPDLPPSHLIGLAARGNPGEPLLSYDELVRDAQLSRAMGVSEVVVYKLNQRLLENLGADFVQRFVSDVNGVGNEAVVEVRFARPVSILVYSVLMLDILLNTRGWGILLLATWFVMSGIIAHYSVQTRRERKCNSGAA
jgi:hypothetical protein